MGFSGDSAVKNLPANAGNMGSVPGSGRSPAEGNGKPVKYFLSGKSHEQRSLYSPGSHKIVRHDLATKQQQHPSLVSYRVFSLP